MHSRPTVFVRASMLAASLVSLSALAGVRTPLFAADEVLATISIKNHRFEPAELKVPAGKAIKITVKNLDATPEEFESKTLKFEKVIPGKGTAIIRLKPLTKGTYTFFGEYHEATAQGRLIVE